MKKLFWIFAFVIITAPGFVEASDYNKGLTLAQSGEYSAAASVWEEIVRNNKPGATKSAYSLGSLYLDGLGVPRDQSKALGYYKISALLDYHPGQFRVGVVSIMAGADTQSEYLLENGLMWMMVAAAKGYPQAIQMLPQFKQLIPIDIQNKARTKATRCIRDLPANCL